ncbi:MAG: hypothetical protein HRT73_13000 [Flavobacteriales bacterium]|nr:hypothetical protein [Flavobacteriales bacterium]
MIKTIKYSILVLVSATLFSCEKKELPVPAHDPGDVITNSVSMNSDYRYQLFFDLETNTMVKRNLKTDWDLGFETTASGFHIILNTAKAMFSANTFQTDFSLITDTTGLIFKWDEPSGHIDSTAIKDWRGAQNVYVIDRGYNEIGLHLGFKKVVFQSVNSIEYVVRFANLDGTNDITYQVAKDDQYNFAFLSLNSSGSIASIQPLKEDWDIVFTQYINIFYDQDPPLPYLVTGTITNRNKVEVAQVFDKDFSAITLADVANYSLSPNINTIGYDWKFYDFDTGQYAVDVNQNYIIKSTEGKYFKLHFIDFYNTSGIKGTPTFEFQEM